MTHRRGWIALDQMTTSTERGAIAGSLADCVPRCPAFSDIRSGRPGTVLRGLAATPGPATVRARALTPLSRVFPLRLTIPSAALGRGGRPPSPPCAGPGRSTSVIARSKPCSACRPAASSTGPRRRPVADSSASAASRPRSGDDLPPAIDFTIVIEAPAADRLAAARHSHDRTAAALDRPALAHGVDRAAARRRRRARRHGHPPHQTCRRRQPRQRLGAVRRAALRVAAAAARRVALARDVRAHGCARRHRRPRSMLRARRRRPPTEAERYARWVVRNTPSTPQLAALAADVAGAALQPLISVITPVYNTDPRVAPRLRRVGAPAGLSELGAVPVRRRVDRRRDRSGAARVRGRPAHPHRRSLPTNAASPARRTRRWRWPRGEFVALLDHDDELTPDALAEVVSR